MDAPHDTSIIPYKLIIPQWYYIEIKHLFLPCFEVEGWYLGRRKEDGYRKGIEQKKSAVRDKK